MKILKFILIAIIGGLTLTACEEFDFLTLKRDNPLDNKNKDRVVSDSTDTVADNSSIAVVYAKYEVFGREQLYDAARIYLTVYLKNNGTKTAKDVRATFSTTSQHVTDLMGNMVVSYGDIEPNTSQAPTSPYPFSIGILVPSSTPTNTAIPFNINIVDANNNTCTSNFSAIVN
ncbi:MAG: hypothetical protein LBR36_09425 [Bacteroidales bacterium]|jgi:hypothetical protein|nr:hypothetical protein [Bacteroidales bacterium]